MNIIEKRIREKARQRFEAEYKKMLAEISKNEILKGLTFDKKPLYLGACVFSENCFMNGLDGKISKTLEEHTNYNELKEKLIKKYEEEEQDKLLDKIEIIKEFLENIE